MYSVATQAKAPGCIQVKSLDLAVGIGSRSDQTIKRHLDVPEKSTSWGSGWISQTIDEKLKGQRSFPAAVASRFTERQPHQESQPPFNSILHLPSDIHIEDILPTKESDSKTPVPSDPHLSIARALFKIRTMVSHLDGLDQTLCLTVACGFVVSGLTKWSPASKTSMVSA